MNNPDFLVWTDGSGYKDGFGGWAAYVHTPDKTHELFRMGAVVGTSVDRAELTGIIEGLQMVADLMTIIPHKLAMGQRVWKPKVKMYSDRENLVLSIQKVNARSNSPDLWRRFEFYEGFMALDANHVLRETDFPEFVFVDLHASSARIIAKQYAEASGLPRSIIEI